MLRETSIRSAIGITSTLSLLVAFLLGAAGASAQEGQSKPFDERSIRGYDYTGAYAQFGVSVGRIDIDDVGPFDVDNEAAGGFTITGGYRFLPWLSGEANFTYMAGEDNVDFGPFDADAEYWAFAFGPKFYPLGLLETDAVPHIIQPYALVAIGGGEIEIDGPGGANDDEDSFIARFILGFDVWATDHIGLFVEGGGHVVEEDVADGVGIFTVGGQYRF